MAVTAYVRQFLNNSRLASLSRLTGTLTASEPAQASLQWIHHVQHTIFGDEINNLTSKSHCLSLVKQLRLFIDHDGLLRCGGRIHNAPLLELAKFPYLLPSRHTFTTLVIKNAHVTQLHGGLNATLTAICQKYWIPSARQRINTVIRKCVTCRKTSGKPYAMPDPPPLVKSWVSNTDPFTVTEVDYTGVLYVRTPGGEYKVYLCLFTCAVSRAIHLEVVPDLTADSFLQAFPRFAGRSVPKLR